MSDFKDHYVDDMPNEDYHQPELGLSTSALKYFITDPAGLIWSHNAKQDADKMNAIDFGTDFHSYFLEPDVFGQKYRVLPEFNRRKPAEKQAELDLIQQWKDDGIVSVKAEDMDKLQAMASSAKAHPTVDAIMSMDGVAERSFFWKKRRNRGQMQVSP